MKIGIAIDSWKLLIFERHLTQAGYVFEDAGTITNGVTLLKINTSNPEAASEVITAAHLECAKTGAPK